jgi:hypothetical protein
MQVAFFDGYRSRIVVWHSQPKNLEWSGEQALFYDVGTTTKKYIKEWESMETKLVLILMKS